MRNEEKNQTSLEKARQVFALTSKGMKTKEACANVGLGYSNYYLLKSNNDFASMPLKRKYAKRQSVIDIPVAPPPSSK